MSQNVASGNTQVTGSVTTSVSSLGGTEYLWKSVEASSSATVTVGTVPAGKEWRIVAISINIGATASGGYSASGKLSIDGVSVMEVQNGHSVAMSNSNSLSIAPNYIVANAEEVIRVSSACYINTRCTIIYEEVTL